MSDKITELEKKLQECEKDYEYLKDVLAEIQQLAESHCKNEQVCRKLLAHIADKATNY